MARAIVVSETAPLLTAAGWSESNPTLQLTNSQVGYLTYPIGTFFGQPQQSAVYLSYDAALLLLVFVLLIIIAGRVVIAVSRRHAE